MRNGTAAIVAGPRRPDCDFPSIDSNGDAPCQATAQYDFRTSDGHWANGCKEHYEMNRMHQDLGLGKGQQLFTQEEWDAHQAASVSFDG